MNSCSGPVIPGGERIGYCMNPVRQDDRLRAGIDIERLYQAGQQITMDVVGCK